MSETVLKIEVLESNPNIHGGRPIISGTTIKISEVALLYTTGEKLSYQQIAERYGLSLGQANAALAYYYLHQAEIDEEIRRDAEEDKRNHLDA